MDGVTELFGKVDVAVVAAIGVIVTMVATEVLKALANAKAWGPLQNPMREVDTDRWMPLVAMCTGIAYAMLISGGEKGADTVRNGLLYGGASIVAFNLFKKTVLGK